MYMSWVIFWRIQKKLPKLKGCFQGLQYQYLWNQFNFWQKICSYLRRVGKSESYPIMRRSSPAFLTFFNRSSYWCCFWAFQSSILLYFILKLWDHTSRSWVWLSTNFSKILACFFVLSLFYSTTLAFPEVKSLLACISTFLNNSIWTFKTWNQENHLHFCLYFHHFVYDHKWLSNLCCCVMNYSNLKFLASNYSENW